MATKFVEVETLDKREFCILELEYISSGSFAEVFKFSDDSVILFVSPQDKSRFLISQIESIHIPKNVYLGQCIVGGAIKDVYIAPLYLPVKQVIYTRKENTEAILLDMYFQNYGRQASKYNMQVYIDGMIAYFERKEIKQSIIDAIKAIWNIVKEYGYILEFPFWNLAQDKNGNLILLDIAFIP